MLSAILLLLQLWDSGTQETDNERSAQGTSAPLLPLLQRFQNMLCGKDAPHAEGDTLVSVLTRLPRFSVILRARLLQTKPEHVSVRVVAGRGDTEAGGRACPGSDLCPPPFLEVLSESRSRSKGELPDSGVTRRP